MRLDYVTLNGFYCLYLFHQFPGGYSKRAPPDPMPNSEVKTLSADDSVDFHVKVGHCQVFLETAEAPKEELLASVYKH